jgi:hypothetical protein
MLAIKVVKINLKKSSRYSDLNQTHCNNERTRLQPDLKYGLLRRAQVIPESSKLRHIRSYSPAVQHTLTHTHPPTHTNMLVWQLFVVKVCINFRVKREH